MTKRIDIQIEKQIRDLYNTGIGTNKIAVDLGIHRSTVQKYLKLSNTKLRKKSPQFLYNIDFFSNYSAESCYWAGFIMADGNIRSDRETLGIHLNKKDQEHLIKFKNAINGQTIIQENVDNSVAIFINGPWFPKQLKNNFLILPKKSLIATFPLQIPKHFYHHFIRGVYDGDGSITIKFVDIPYITFTGTRDILVNIETIINDHTNVKLKSRNVVPPLQDHHNGSVYQISYSGKNAAIILNWLYYDSTENTRLSRKYDIWNNIKDKYAILC